MSPAFDPLKTVLVDGPVPPGSESAEGVSEGSVSIVSYAPKHLVLNAEVKAPAILVSSDHYDPDWKVLVDGRPAALLRCDFLLRGVQLAPGAHRVEFQFEPATGWLGVSVAASAVALLLAGLLAVPAKTAPGAASVAASSAAGTAAPEKVESGKPASEKPGRPNQGRKKPAEDRRRNADRPVRS
jgi:hypothetical protein